MKAALRPALRLGAVTLSALLGCCGILWASGVAWFWLGGRSSVLPSPWLPWSMRLHGAAAMVFLYLAGTLFHRHMRHAWLLGRNRWSGAIMATCALLLVLSGYGLYYADADRLRRTSEYLHWFSGFGLPLLLALHMVLGRRASQR